MDSISSVIIQYVSGSTNVSSCERKAFTNKG